MVSDPSNAYPNNSKQTTCCLCTTAISTYIECMYVCVYIYLINFIVINCFTNTKIPEGIPAPTAG